MSKLIIPATWIEALAMDLGCRCVLTRITFPPSDVEYNLTTGYFERDGIPTVQLGVDFLDWANHNMPPAVNGWDTLPYMAKWLGVHEAAQSPPATCTRCATLNPYLTVAEAGPEWVCTSCKSYGEM